MEAEVKELLEKAEATDAEEDRQYGEVKRGDELPEELAFREKRLKKIQEAREALEIEAKREAKLARKGGKKATGIPDDKAQRNFTDPESKIMPAPGGKHFEQAYNAQAAVDSANQIIVAADIVDVYIPPDKINHTDKNIAMPRGRIPNGLSLADRMRRKLRTKRGREHYGLRKELSEPVFGQIKQARGFRQFLMRGKKKVKSEWRFICTGHNLLKLFAAWRNGLLGQLFESERPQLAVM